MSRTASPIHAGELTDLDQPGDPSDPAAATYPDGAGAAPGRRRRRGRRRGPRWVLRLISLILAACVLYVLESLGQVIWYANQHDRVKVEDIVVLGSAQYNGVPSPDLESRLAHALELWKAGLAPDIVVTGGKEPGDVYTEATAGATWLADHGVPMERIVRVPNGRDTWESLTAVAAVLRPLGVHRLLLVSDPYHMARSLSMIESLGFQGWVNPTPNSPIKGGAVVPYYAKETIEMSLGRIIGWRRMSELIHG